MFLVNINHSDLALRHTMIPAPAIRPGGRFQVVVEYAEGVCISAATAETHEDAVEAFMAQSPGCEHGEVSLIDRNEQRIVASVKWKMATTENGLRVAHRQNVFHDWHLALIALVVQKRREVGSFVGLRD
ncbi:MAG: hypothetical protein QM790_19415 [Nibricoccus sp.]